MDWVLRRKDNISGVVVVLVIVVGLLSALFYTFLLKYATHYRITCVSFFLLVCVWCVYRCEIVMLTSAEIIEYFSLIFCFAFICIYFFSFFWFYGASSCVGRWLFTIKTKTILNFLSQCWVILYLFCWLCFAFRMMKSLYF